MHSNEKRYKYNVEISVADFSTIHNEVLITKFTTISPIEFSASPQEILELSEGSEGFEFETLVMTTDPEIHSVVSTFMGLNIYKDKDSTIFGQIVLIDGLKYRPFDQIGDVYDNLWGSGFEINSFVIQNVNSGSLPYDVEMEGSKV